MYKRWRVYSTFLTGLAIGLLYALLLGNPWSDTAGIIEWPILVLSFSGIFGGIIYAIVINGEVEMPRFLVDRGGVFKAGLFGDILIGIAGAFILELILPLSLSAINPTEPDTAAVLDQTRLQGSAIAATGLIGGYGGRAIVKFSLERFFKHAGTLDEFRANAILQERSQRTVQQSSRRAPALQDPELETESPRADEHTAALIERVDRYIQRGASESDEATLVSQLRSEPDSVHQAVFFALIELREAIADGLSNEQLQRMGSLFDILIQTSPNEHPLYYQLALTHTKLNPPAYAAAAAALDRAIQLRGLLTISQPWQYELLRATVNIEQAQATTEDFTISASVQESILTDLESIAQIYNIETILKAADKQQIPKPVVNWIRHNPVFLEEREALRSLLPAVRSVIEGSSLRPIGTPPSTVSGTAVSTSNGKTAVGATSPTHKSAAATGQNQHPSAAVFPEIFSALGRCYDLLSLDPFNILGHESAKATQVFDFYPHEARLELDEKETILIPKSTRYIPGSHGKMQVSSQSNLLYTESDIQKAFSSTLGATLTQLMGAILPFSLSTSYAKFKRDRSAQKNIYAFTKAEYVHYTLALDRQQSTDLHVNETFRQAVAQLPLVSNYEYLNFITDFGTHTAIQVQFGGLFHHRYCLTQSSYASMVQAGGNVSVEAKRAFEAKYENKRQGSTFKEFSNSSEVYDFCGGMKQEKIHDWFATIKADPAPIHLELMPLYELLSSRFFPEDDQIIKKRSLLTTATQTYLEKNSQAIPWELWTSATVGGNGGESFFDIDLSPMRLETNQEQYQNARVKEVRVWIKNWVERVQIVLDGIDDVLPLQGHGNEEGKLHRLQLDPDDHITAVSIMPGSPQRRFIDAGTYVGSIRIQTHKQKEWVVGTPDPRAIALDIPEGYQVIGFHGRCGNHIDKLGVISIPVA
ncbi:MAG: MAC/perforin domain-containing protein [Cyanobacteria bacterium P01_D01_bin.36]